MRHLLFVCVLIGQFGLAASAFAQLLAYAGFDYKEGSSLTGANGGVGWKDAWFSRGNATKGCTIGQAQSHPGLDTSGNCCLQDGTDIRICRYIDTSRPEVADLGVDGANGKTFGTHGTTIWISFLISCTSFPKLAHGGIHFMDGIVPAPQNFKS